MSHEHFKEHHFVKYVYSLDYMLILCLFYEICITKCFQSQEKFNKLNKHLKTRIKNFYSVINMIVVIVAE